MRTLHTDVVIIGRATAGALAYRSELAHTPKVLMIENGPCRTTCARVNWTLSKLLSATAEAPHLIRHADCLGITSGEVRADGKAALARMRIDRDRFVGFLVDARDHWSKVHHVAATKDFVHHYSKPPAIRTVLLSISR